MLPHPLQNLITQFTKLPGIGPRQAARFAFYLLRNAYEINALENMLHAVRQNVTLCSLCFLPAAQVGSGSALCHICFNGRRNKNLICVIEKETDAVNLEKTNYFQGCYFVLGGFINPLEKESLAHERLAILIHRLQTNPSPFELILAFTPRREGDFTSLYIQEHLKPLKEQGLNIKITRLGRGLSSGAELEYADQDTLRNALDGRK